MPMTEKQTTEDDWVWLIPTQSMPAVATTVVQSMLGRDLDEQAAMRLVARWSQVVGRDSDNTLAFPNGNALGFGDFPDHLARGLWETGRVPSAKEILNDPANSWVERVIGGMDDRRRREAYTVRAILCICGAQVDAAVTTGPNSMRRFEPVSETQGIGEDMYNSATGRFVQLKNFTSFRGGSDYNRLTRNEPFIPTDEDGKLKKGYMAMEKGEHTRKVWTYCRTGDGRVAVSRHYPSAQEVAIQQTHPHYVRGRGVRSTPAECQNKEILNKRISHYARITDGVDPETPPEDWESEESL